MNKTLVSQLVKQNFKNPIAVQILVDVWTVWAFSVRRLFLLETQYEDDDGGSDEDYQV